MARSRAVGAAVLPDARPRVAGDGGRRQGARRRRRGGGGGGGVGGGCSLGLRFNLPPFINHPPNRSAYFCFQYIYYIIDAPMAATCALIYHPLLINITGYMGTSRLYRNSRENGKVQEENPRKTRRKSRIFIVSPRNFGQNPFQNLRKTRPIILNRSQPPPTLPDPFYIDFIFSIFFLKKRCLCFYVFPIFSLFVQLWRLQDQSQIVDLIFPLKPVSSRASETPKVPHS